MVGGGRQWGVVRLISSEENRGSGAGCRMGHTAECVDKALLQKSLQQTLLWWLQQTLPLISTWIFIRRRYNETLQQWWSEVKWKCLDQLANGSGLLHDRSGSCSSRMDAALNGFEKCLKVTHHCFIHTPPPCSGSYPDTEEDKKKKDVEFLLMASCVDRWQAPLSRTPRPHRFTSQQPLRQEIPPSAWPSTPRPSWSPTRGPFTGGFCALTHLSQPPAALFCLFLFWLLILIFGCFYEFQTHLNPLWIERANFSCGCVVSFTRSVCRGEKFN